MRARLPSVVTALVAMVVTLSGCGASSESPESTETGSTLTKVNVSGRVGERPTVSFDWPMTIADSGRRVLTRGTGGEILPDRPFLLQLSIFDARTGNPAVSTFDRGQSARLVRGTQDDLFPVLQSALIGMHEGGRVLVAAAGKDAYGEAGAPQYGIKRNDPLLMVADVVAVPPEKVLSAPQGTPQKLPARAPKVLTKGKDVTGVGFPRSGLKKPRKLKVYTLIRGDGPKIQPTSLVTLDTLGQLWNKKSVVSSTFGKEPTTVAVGTGAVIKAWDRALVGVPQGSRVMLIAPPSLAYKKTGSPPSIPGSATLVYVIDVLGVS